VGGEAEGGPGGGRQGLGARGGGQGAEGGQERPEEGAGTPDGGGFRHPGPQGSQVGGSEVGSLPSISPLTPLHPIGFHIKGMYAAQALKEAKLAV